MITIQEKISEKMPGITSLFLSFTYTPQYKDLVNIIKSSGDYWFDKDTKLWELPVTNLSYLLDNLTFFDDIKLILHEDDKHSREQVKTTLDYELKPFPYQQEGIEYGLNHDKWLLLDAPGLGKTKQIIHLAEELKAQKNLEHCLIICGINTLKTNWKKEIAKHSKLSAIILGEKENSKNKVKYLSVTERAEQLKNDIEQFFIITNIETFRSEDVLKALKKSKNKIDMIVVDEVHKCKSHDSQQGKNLLKLKNAKYKVAATGTLLLNNPLDAYVPLKWIDVERSNFTTFKNYYCKFGGPMGNQIIGFKNIETLKYQLAENSLRRTKDLLDLPPKTIINEIIDMNDKHRKFYDDIVAGVKDEVDKVEITTSSLLAMVTRLRQATACPSILTTSSIESSKIDRAVDLVEEILNGGEKVVIFSTFKETVRELENKLSKYNPVIATGDTPDEEISKNIDLFQEDNEYKIFLGTWQKAGTGITLTKANYMIFLDTPWTAGVFEQACDRIYRIGTKDPVFIYNLICKDTIDERVADILDTKKAISDYMIDDKLSEDNFNILKDYIEQDSLDILKQYIQEL